MNKNIRHNQTIYIGIAIIIIIFIVAGFMLSKKQDTLEYQISLNLITEIIGGIIFSVIVLYFIKNKDTNEESTTNLDDYLSHCKNNQLQYNSLLKEFNDRILKGIVNIREKDKYEPDFWNNFINTANKELILSGNTLYKWTVQPYGQMLIKNVKRIVQNGGKVKILVLKYNSENTLNMSQVKSVDYNARIRKTITFINDKIYNDLTKEEINKIEIKWLKTLAFPYIINKSDNKVLISPNLIKEDSSNSSNLLFELKENSRFGEIYLNDFYHLFSSEMVEDVNIDLFKTDKNE